MAALVKHPALCSRPHLPFNFCHTPVLYNLPRRFALVVCAREDFDFSNGPREVIKPKFIRSEFPSLLEPVKEGLDTSGTPKRKGRRPFRKATPLQVVQVLWVFSFLFLGCVKAMSGAMIGGGCTALAFKVTRQAYQNLEAHPPAHDLPLNLTSEVNQLLLTMVAGFGGLVVCMFGVSCVGLGLLSVQLITTPKNPPDAP